MLDYRVLPQALLKVLHPMYITALKNPGDPGFQEHIWPEVPPPVYRAATGTEHCRAAMTRRIRTAR